MRLPPASRFATRGASAGGTRNARPTLAELVGLVRSFAIYRARPWRRRALTRFYGTLLAPDALAFDVGAHLGNRTGALRSLGARCVALEPQPLFARALARRFGDDPRISLLDCAAGRTAGSARLAISRRHPTVSTLSRDWIERVGASAGFERVRWDRELEVAVTTLDALIAEHGLPDFCKIDVEGMEGEILAGLSTPIPLVAIEYLPAALNIALECIDRLDALGRYAYNFSVGESHRFALARWTDGEGLREALRGAARDGGSGDFYARLLAPPATARLRLPRGFAPPAERPTRNGTNAAGTPNTGGAPKR